MYRYGGMGMELQVKRVLLHVFASSVTEIDDYSVFPQIFVNYQ